ncbi:FAD-dependent oxidoreductase [Oceanimonas sp. NS1]|nr:FAD-dependent oxidoreductase [Oceanimonas sp. NS1]
MTRTAYGEGEAYIPLLLRARALWAELEQLSGERLFEPCGVLNLGVADSPFLAQVRRSAAEYGLALEQESAAGIEARWPGWRLPAGFSGGYEPEAGVLYCERALSAWHRLGSAQGARLLGGRTVTGLKAIPGGMGVELADGERFTAAQVLVCAGQRVAPLMAQLGLHLPLQRVRKTFAWYRADVMRYGPAAFPGFSADLANAVYYGFPTLNGEGFKIGRHDAGQPLNPVSHWLHLVLFPRTGRSWMPLYMTTCRAWESLSRVRYVITFARPTSTLFWIAIRSTKGYFRQCLLRSRFQVCRRPGGNLCALDAGRRAGV